MSSYLNGNYRLKAEKKSDSLTKKDKMAHGRSSILHIALCKNERAGGVQTPCASDFNLEIAKRSSSVAFEYSTQMIGV